MFLLSESYQNAQNNGVNGLAERQGCIKKVTR